MANDGTRILQLVEELNDAFDVFDLHCQLWQCLFCSVSVSRDVFP